MKRAYFVSIYATKLVFQSICDE